MLFRSMNLEQIQKNVSRDILPFLRNMRGDANVDMRVSLEWAEADLEIEFKRSENQKR